MITAIYETSTYAINCVNFENHDDLMKKNRLQLSLFDTETEIKVEDGDGEIHIVRQGSRCSCGSKTPCSHFKQARRYLDRTKGLFYDCKSALHKAVRLGDVERAIAVANILDRYKRNTAKSYLRKIWAEETRNLDLLAHFYDKTPLEQLIVFFCRSIKDWELPFDAGIFSLEWYRILLKYKWMPQGGEINYPWPGIDQIPSAIASMVEADDFDSLLELVVCSSCWCPSAERYKKAVRLSLLDEVEKRSDTLNAPPVVAKLSAQHHNEELIVLWGILAKKRYAKNDHYHEGSSFNREQMDVPYFSDYVFDEHTREGKRRLRACGHLLDWENPMPEGVDLRYSGAEAGTLWRYLAFKQFGSIDVPWESVRLDEEVEELWRKLFGTRLTV